MAMDLERIAVGAAHECVRQQVGVSELAHLLDAYSYALRAVADGDLCPIFVDVCHLGVLIEPHKNQNFFRVTPVTFADGGSSANHQDIPRLVRQWVTAVQEFPDALGYEAIDEFVKELLWIHPFADGNGRLAWIVYNWLAGTLDNPDPLPYYFGEAITDEKEST